MTARTTPDTTTVWIALVNGRLAEDGKVYRTKEAAYAALAAEARTRRDSYVSTWHGPSPSPLPADDMECVATFFDSYACVIPCEIVG